MTKLTAWCLLCLSLAACGGQRPASPPPLITDKGASRLAHAAGVIRSGDWIIHHSPSELWAEHAVTKQRQVLYSLAESLRYCQELMSESSVDVEPEYELSGALLSVVADTVSYRLYERGYCGGAHPFVSTSFHAQALGAPRELPLSALFGGQLDEAIEDAQARAPYAMSAIDPECEGAVEELTPSTTSFAFHRISGQQVVVRVGLSHSYEVCRGTFAQVELTLTPSAELMAQLKAAQAGGLLMERLSPMMPAR